MLGGATGEQILIRHLAAGAGDAGHAPRDRAGGGAADIHGHRHLSSQLDQRRVRMRQHDLPNGEHLRTG